MAGGLQPRQSPESACAIVPRHYRQRGADRHCREARGERVGYVTNEVMPLFFFPAIHNFQKSLGKTLRPISVIPNHLDKAQLN